MQEQKIAVFPGSFDPLTNGHCDIIARALPLFDKIIIAIGRNSEKNCMFSLEERMDFVRRTYADQPKIEVTNYEGMTVDFCRSIGVKFMLRGLRNPSDFEFEKAIAQTNRRLCPDIETVFLLTSSGYSFISSSIVREILTYNGSVCDAVWSASAGYNTQTGVYGTCSSRDAWGTEVPYLQSVESPYEEQYHNLLRRSIGKDYTYVEYNDSRTGEPYTDADTTHKSLGGYVQYNTFVSNGRSYRYIGQFVSSRYCFDFGTDENGTPCMTYYGFGHGVGMSQCGAVGYAAERNMGYKAILRHYYKGASITSQGSNGGLFGWLRSLFG